MDVFESIKLLQKNIEPQNMLKVMHGSHIWTAKFEWSLSCGKCMSNKLTLPDDYSLFLQDISNGCLLYYDLIYGQWGFRLYSDEELNEKQQIWKDRFGSDWQANLIAFGELCGEGHVLLFDTAQATKEKTSCAILEGNPIDTITDWPKVSRSFHEWVDHLITAQGDKYWEWK
jgi:hypothetical protein